MLDKIYKCRYCGGDVFELEAVPDGNNRYAHPKCVANKYEMERARKRVISMCEKHIDNINYARINQQLNQLMNEGWSLDEIYKALAYWYEIKGGSSVKAAGGIGIVEYVINDALDFWKKYDDVKRSAKKVHDVEPPKEVTIKKHRIEMPTRFKLFEMR